MYIIQEQGKIILADEDLQRLEDTLKFMPQYDKRNIEEVLEASIVKAYTGDYYLVGYAPSQALSEIKTLKRNEINQAREQARLDEGAEYDNDLFDIDENSLSIITAKMTLAKENTEKTFVYRSKTNQNHEFLGSDIINIWQKINDKIESIYQKSWDLKTKIDNATTKEEIEVIKWNM